MFSYVKFMKSLYWKVYNNNNDNNKNQDLETTRNTLVLSQHGWNFFFNIPNLKKTVILARDVHYFLNQ